ncbi:MAG: HlyD family efflux transporter periplasmic adaptor subunit [Planctomycetota bacterium]|nr:HlyD family efflux transporter periplasmic adaptor subunit [Planctomycetota bacterium]
MRRILKSLLVLSTCFLVGGVRASGQDGRTLNPAESNPAESNPVDATPSESDSYEVVRLDHCLVSIIDQVEVPAEVGGVISSISVRSGFIVKQGQSLARLDGRRTMLQREIATIKQRQAKAVADSDVDVRDAESAAQSASQALQAAQDANQRNAGAVSVAEMRRQQSEADRARFAVERAKQNQRLARLAMENSSAELRAIELELAMRDIKASMSGVVVDVYKHAGEWTSPGEPVAKIVGLQRLLIEGYVDAAKVGPHQVAKKPVQVTATLDNKRVEQFAGQIVFVNPTVETHGKYRVWAEVRNRQDKDNWLLRPGLIVEMSIQAAKPAESIAVRSPQGQMWHIHAQGRTWGPFPVQRVQQAIERGEVSATALVWTAGYATWRTTADVPAFRQPLTRFAAQRRTPAPIRPPIQSPAAVARSRFTPRWY